MVNATIAKTIDVAADTLISTMPLEKTDAVTLISKAITGGEIVESSGTAISEWIEKRLKPNAVLIDLRGYTTMCVDALKIATSTAPTDYGSSRQRDLGQLWADLTRGYLGEYAFKLFLQNNWSIEIALGHEKGKLVEYLANDIAQVRDRSGNWRVPLKSVSIKTTKINGVWLDIPGDQFSHSQIHALVKVAAGRDHLFGFFKYLSVFKDKVLASGVSAGNLTGQEADALFKKLPDFREIPAFICGFVKRDVEYAELSYRGKPGSKNYTITSWNGPISPGDLDKIKTVERVAGKVSFEGIGEFAHEKGFLFNTGSLRWTREEWHEVTNSI